MKYDTANSEVMVLMGLLVPAQWDKNGDVIGLTLSCQDEKEYVLMMDNAGKKLISSLRKEVAIKGISLKESYKDIIKVISYWEL